MKTFKEQFDKLTRAYINEEVQPFNACACFVGNLLNNQSGWTFIRNYDSLPILDRSDRDSYLTGVQTIVIQSDNTYTPQEIAYLEYNFMKIVCNEKGMKNTGPGDIISEDLLFEAFESTLDMLKKIHESKGEVVEPFTFIKRTVKETVNES